MMERNAGPCGPAAGGEGVRLRLYGYWRSSSAWRVRIALHWKQLSHERVAVHLVRDGGEQHGAAFLARNPMAQVPVLEWIHGEHVWRLTQSLAILEWLEEAHPEPPLLPRDPFARARARELALLVVSGIQPLQNLAVLQRVEALGGARRAWAAEWIERGLGAMERMLSETAGTYCVGDTVSFADVCLVPQLYNARRFGVTVERFERLAAIERACEQLPAFQAAHPDAQPDRPNHPTP